MTTCQQTRYFYWSKFLEIQLSKLTQEEIEIWIDCNKKGELIILTLLTKKRPAADGFASTFHQLLKKIININPSQTLPKNRRGGNTSQLCETRISLKTKGITRKLQITISYENRYKISQQNTSKLNPATNKNDYTWQSSGIYSRKAKLNMSKSMNVTHHINMVEDQIKNKNKKTWLLNRQRKTIW